MQCMKCLKPVHKVQEMFRFQKQGKGIVIGQWAIGHSLIWAWSYIFTDLSDQVAGATVHLFPNL